MGHRTSPDDLLLVQVDDDEVLVGCVEEGQEGEGEARSHGEELPDLLVHVRRAHLVAARAIYGDDVGGACKEWNGG